MSLGAVRLVTPKNFLRWMGILPISEEDFPSSMKEQRLNFNLLHIYFVKIWLICYFTSVFYFMVFVANSFGQYTESGLFFTLSVLRLTLHFILSSKRSQISSIIEDMESLVDRRCSTRRIHRIYEENIERSERFANKLWSWIRAITVIAFVPKIIISFYKYYVKGLGEKSFGLILTSKFPWSYRKPFGYFVIVMTQFSWLYGGVIIVIGTTLPFVGFSVLFEAMALDICTHLSDLSDSITDGSQSFSAKNRIELRKRFNKIVEFHTVALKLTERFSILYSAILMAFFALSSTCICLALLSLNESVGKGSIAEIIRLAIILFFVIIYIIFLCFFGDRVTTKFGLIFESINQSSWYEFPLNMQKDLNMMIIIARKPIYIEGYMNTRCTREVFQKIINAAFSYFSVMRGASD